MGWADGETIGYSNSTKTMHFVPIKQTGKNLAESG